MSEKQRPASNQPPEFRPRHGDPCLCSTPLHSHRGAGIVPEMLAEVRSRIQSQSW